MEMKKNTLLLIVGLLNLLSCSGSENSPNEPLSNITLELAYEQIEVKGISSTFNLDIEVKEGKSLSYIAVRKLKNNSPVYRLPDIKAENISAGKCTFSYTILKDDLKGGQLSFHFIPVDDKEHFGTEYLLTVDIADQKKILEVASAMKIARMTGNSAVGETIPNPNQTAERYNIGGSDLGIYWKMGEGKVGVLFGDTYGRDWRPGHIPDWRSNVLAFSSDTNLEDGITFDGMVCDENGSAKEIIYSAHDTSQHGDYSSIPTAAIRLHGADYIHYMNVKSWKPNWTTNWSGYAVSQDDGQTWELHKELFSARSKFAQQALWEKDEYVYAIGSVVGRRGLPYLARFKPENILLPQTYEYWNKEEGWIVGDENNATALFGNYLDQMYAEPTLVYHDYFKKWISVYYNEIKNQIVLRSCDELTGNWSEESVIAKADDYPMPYGGFIYPLNLTEPYIYISLSQWDPLYNVFLMKVNIDIIKE